MAGFIFPLQRLLELRSRAEDFARCHHAESQRRARHELARLEGLQQACEDAAEAVSAAPGQMVQPDRLLNNDLHHARLRAQALSQQARVEQCHDQEAERREELVLAARQRQVIERLRERRYAQHCDHQEQTERKTLDEAATAAFIRQKTQSQ